MDAWGRAGWPAAGAGNGSKGADREVTRNATPLWGNQGEANSVDSVLTFPW